MRGQRGTESSGAGDPQSGPGLSERARGSVDPLIRELSIAQAIVDVATDHAAGRIVAAVELRVGHEREVAWEGLDFAFSLLTVGTALDGAELEIERVAGGELAVQALRLLDAR